MLGATEADRLRLRWDVAEPKTPAQKPAANPQDDERNDTIMRLITGGKQ